MTGSTQKTENTRSSFGEIFGVFLLLGLTSFGGPVAHLGYFRNAFVTRRKWLGDAAYADLVALCQFLPGPASSQVGMGIGLLRGGYAGMAAAWIGFTLPSALLLVGFAYGTVLFGDLPAGILAGLKAAAAGVVAHALMGMAKSLTPDRERAAIAVLGLTLVLVIGGVWGQLAAIAAGALAGFVWLKPDLPEDHDSTWQVPGPKTVSLVLLGLFFVLLALLPLMATLGPSWSLFDGFYRAGALVFGGGHVVLPLLQAEMVQPGLVDTDAFLAGYGAAQAVPGPLFTFAAYLGTVANVPPNGWLGALIALAAIFLPSALLIAGGMPFWASLRQSALARRLLMGVNAAVVGLLGAALYDPVFLSGVTSPHTMALAAVCFTALAMWRVPAWAVVIVAGLIGWVLL